MRRPTYFTAQVPNIRQRRESRETAAIEADNSVHASASLDRVQTKVPGSKPFMATRACAAIQTGGSTRSQRAALELVL
jgi:hypothetical protein